MTVTKTIEPEGMTETMIAMDNETESVHQHHNSIRGLWQHFVGSVINQDTLLEIVYVDSRHQRDMIVALQ
ncbi:hypothetical protein FRX31_015330 [Thalictrum thalictroides]|uniref:Uncharacterized protein n=1 Tax=Thalictrum thalictroides TaxID=46969 RepID=A0A7J6WCC4_THATH|nr:hypothetical protein FRX31_015330 [Thalictrum thalictroides]